MFCLLPPLQADAQTRTLGGTVSKADAECAFCPTPAVFNVVPPPPQARGSNKQGIPQPSGGAEVCPGTGTLTASQFEPCET